MRGRVRHPGQTPTVLSGVLGVEAEARPSDEVLRCRTAENHL